MKKSIYLLNDAQLKREANTLCLITGQGKRFIPVEDVSEIHVLGELDLNKKLLEFLSLKEIILHFYNYYDYYVGSFYPREHLNSGYMTVKQVEHYLNPTWRLEVARSFVEGAYKNIRQVLAYYQRRDKDVQEIIKRIDNLALSITTNETIEKLMATEGHIREIYYTSFDKILGNSEFPFQSRSRRPTSK